MIRLVVRNNEFTRIAATLEPKLAVVVATTALEVEGAAKTAVPVKTGNLRRSLHTQPLDPLHALVGTDVEYAAYVEYGTRYMGAQPYLTPAVEFSRARFVAAVRAVISHG